MNERTNEKGRAIKAVLDARRVPFELFGQGHAAHLRKFIFMYLATWADPDGTEAYPALETIAGDCGLTVRGLSDVLTWLKDHGLIGIQSKGSHLGTNKYSVMISPEALDAARLKVESDEDQIRLRAKTENTRKARSDAAKARWAKKNTSADIERSVPSELREDVERSVLGGMEQSVPGGHGTDCIAPGTLCMEPGTQRSNDRPLNRPKDRQSPSFLPELDAWQDGRGDMTLSGPFKDILQQITGKVLELTKKESAKLDALPAAYGQYGHLKALLGIYEFTKRDKGFVGLTAPATLFLENANDYIHQALTTLDRHLAAATRVPKKVEWVRYHRERYFGQTTPVHDDRITGIAGTFEYGGQRPYDSKKLFNELKARDEDSAFKLFLEVGPLILMVRYEVHCLADEHTRKSRMAGIEP